MNPSLLRGLVVFFLLIAAGVITSVILIWRAGSSGSRMLVFRGLALVWIGINLVMLLLVILLK